MVSTTVNKAKSTSSATTIKMRSVKTSNINKTTKVKPFNMHKFLLKHHSSDNVHFFGAIDPKYWNWSRQIKCSSVGNLEGLIILLDSNERVLYIGHTSHVGSYVLKLSNRYNAQVNKVFIVCNENPSMYVHAVTAYRAKFKPVLNSERNQRFMFDSTTTVLNLNSRTERALEWIKTHPNARLKDFFTVYTKGDLIALCKCFSVGRVSYKDLKVKLFKTKSNIKVVTKEELFV